MYSILITILGVLDTYYINVLKTGNWIHIMSDILDTLYCTAMDISCSIYWIYWIHWLNIVLMMFAKLIATKICSDELHHFRPLTQTQLFEIPPLHLASVIPTDNFFHKMLLFFKCCYSVIPTDNFFIKCCYAQIYMKAAVMTAV